MSVCENCEHQSLKHDDPVCSNCSRAAVKHKQEFIEWLENSYKTTENHQHIVAQIIAKAYEKL